MLNLLARYPARERQVLVNLLGGFCSPEGEIKRKAGELIAMHIPQHLLVEAVELLFSRKSQLHEKWLDEFEYYREVLIPSLPRRSSRREVDTMPSNRDVL